MKSSFSQLRLAKAQSAVPQHHFETNPCFYCSGSSVGLSQTPASSLRPKTRVHVKTLLFSRVFTVQPRPAPSPPPLRSAGQRKLRGATLSQLCQNCGVSCCGASDRLTHFLFLEAPMRLCFLCHSCWFCSISLILSSVYRTLVHSVVAGV